MTFNSYLSAFCILLLVEPGVSGPRGSQPVETFRHSGEPGHARDDRGPSRILEPPPPPSILTYLDSIVTGLRVLSNTDQNGIWHHRVASVSGVAFKLGFRIFQELLLIQPSSDETAIPCTGHSPEDIRREFRKIKECQEFNVVVTEGMGFKSITGFIGRRRGQPGAPGPGPHGQPGPPGDEQPIIRVTVPLSFINLNGHTVFLYKNETVFIQPYVYPSRYMKNENGNIGFAALRDQEEWKFIKVTYLNLITLVQGRIEAHILFKAFQQPRFIHTDGAALSLLTAEVSQNGTSSRLFEDNTFIQHLADAHAQLGYYEPLSQRGKYIAFNTSTTHLQLVNSRSSNALFYTKRVTQNQRGRHGVQGPRGRTDRFDRRGARGPYGERGPQGPRGETWSYSDNCEVQDRGQPGPV